jgi:outer membrane receptor protein involved in Fe transport
MRDNQRSLNVPITLENGQIVLVSQVANAPRAWSRGFEASASFRPSPAFGARIAIGLLDTRIAETLVPTDPTLGKAFQRAPGLSGTVAVDWRPVPDLSLSAQARGWSSYFSEDSNRQDLRIDGAAVVDLRAAWRVGPVTVSAWARNLFDRFYLTYLFPPAGANPPLATLGEPRQLGVGVDARF